MQRTKKRKTTKADVVDRDWRGVERGKFREVGERKMERDVEEVRRGQKLREKNRTIDDIEKKKKRIQGKIRGRETEVVEVGRDGSRGMRKKNQ